MDLARNCPCLAGSPGDAFVKERARLIVRKNAMRTFPALGIKSEANRLVYRVVGFRPRPTPKHLFFHGVCVPHKHCFFHGGWTPTHVFFHGGADPHAAVFRTLGVDPCSDLGDFSFYWSGPQEVALGPSRTHKRILSWGGGPPTQIKPRLRGTMFLIHCV